jgi:hypothetical protein
MRVEAAEDVAHDTGTLHRLGAAGAGVGQTHALHRIQDAALHRLASVADVGQRTALDHAERVLQIGALGVLAERYGVARI